MEDVNYIVSGLERSGTSMIMQILEAGGFPVLYDNKRESDIHNPKGYYELKEGKIIRGLMNKTFNVDEYKGLAIKITSYGLNYLPKGKYKIIYIERDINEVFASQQKMMGDTLKFNLKDKEVKRILIKMNNQIKNYINNRNDIELLYVKHRNFFTNPKKEIYKISKFIGKFDIENAYKSIDKNLYRNKC